MAKTYLDILAKRGIYLFLTEEKFADLRTLDPTTE